MLAAPFTIDVYDKSFNWLGRVSNPESVVGSVRFNALSTFTITIGATDPMFTEIINWGARVTIIYRSVPLFSGVITYVEGSLLQTGSVSFTVESDWRILQNTLAWVRPDNTLEASTISIKNESHATDQAQAYLLGGASTQGTSGTTIGQTGYYSWPSAVVYSETALKHIIEVNAKTRLGRPLTIATDLGRGGDIKTAGKLPGIRFDRLEDTCLEILSFDGLGLTIQQAPRTSTITVDVYTPTTWDMPLTADSGVIVDGSWSVNYPSATRVILGGPGDLADRMFKGYVDGTGLEAQYGDIIERFRDATSSADMIWPEQPFSVDLQVAKYYLLRSEITAAQKTTFTNSLAASAKIALDEGLPTAGINATLSETETFHFGGTDGIQLGDTVQVQGLTGLLYTETVTAAEFTYTQDEFTVNPIIGTRSDDPTYQLAETIRTIATAQRRISKDR
jgi:hypothetical protein